MPGEQTRVGGETDDGIDWSCPKCGTVLVRGALGERQFLDLLFRCYECGQVAGSALRVPGHPMAGRALLIPPGEYRVEGTVDPGPVMVVGQRAIDGYVREIGAGRGDRLLDGAGRDLSPIGLRVLASDAAELLGDRYADLVAADERGSRSPTPPARRHRLVELIAYAEEAADEIERFGEPRST